MSFTTADLHAKGLTPGDDPEPIAGSDRYRYIVDRQITSFDDGRLPWRFYSLMKPTRPDRETPWAAMLGRFGVDRHSRTYVMVHEEWPKIRAAIDAGALAMIGLVRTVSADPQALSSNHQVLAYGYDTNGSTVVLRICDPNWPRQDDVTITFDSADAMGSIKPVWSKPEQHDLVCFFSYPYQAIDPAPFRPDRIAMLEEPLGRLLLRPDADVQPAVAGRPAEDELRWNGSVRESTSLPAASYASSVTSPVPVTPRLSPV